ncbi:carboxymuconolactone decarboxylase family protein [Mammaliicoccus sciuri]|uniref:carboxymuconolactone decarboxylase family protein n=1 Tax=Mammaliicoccus sciuri TaxID=1296 RepID=UPI003F55FF9C
MLSKFISKIASFLKMDNRFNYFKVNQKYMALILDLERVVKKTSIDKGLRELIKLRCSQINGCTYCQNLHQKKNEKFKIDSNKLQDLTNFNESKLYNEKEKAALQVAEKLTYLNSKISDKDYEIVLKYYSKEEYFGIVMIINQVNLRNRISISSGNI